MTNSNTGGPVVDVNGVPIIIESIVEMSDPHGNWSDFTGLVVDPHSTLEGDGYTVAVYFYREVSPSHFHGRRLDVLPIDQWDRLHKQSDRFSKREFLFVDESWKKSPRIVFFRPDELRVRKSWDLVTLADRLYKDFWHGTLYCPSDKYPQEPSAYMCHLKNCQNPATTIGFFNVWGSVTAIMMCSQCYEKWNGKCGDMNPDCKDTLLDPSGRPITPKT